MQYYTQWERADKAKQSMREIQDRMAEMRLQWPRQQDSESQHPGDDRAGVIVGEPTPVRDLRSGMLTTQARGLG